MVPINIPYPFTLDRIAACESQGMQYYDDGMVVTHENKNGSWDIGMYQINSSWLPTAHRMGLNLYNLKDNIEFGIWLYNREGTTPWNASRNCWSDTS